ncbi:MAG: glucose-6-phosphate isomerase [Cyanobacteria bacterium P01_C01_bin.89]
MTGNIALWQRYQNWLYYNADLELFVDVSRMGFDDGFVAKMQPLFDRAFKDMKALEAGAIANPDEGRQVGHYWLRAPELAPTPELRVDVERVLDDIEAFAGRVHQGELLTPKGERYTDILSVGIGGSALGPQFVRQALAPTQAPLKLHFIDNTDPDGIQRVLDTDDGGGPLRSRLGTTLVLVISKSGGTPETRNGMVEAKAAYTAAGIHFPPHFVAITSQGSKLDQLAKDEDWLKTFPMYDWVGGRTSEFSAVGLVAAALQGIDIRAMLAGAKAMDVATRAAEVKGNPAALLALSWHYAGDGRGAKDMVILPYKDRLLLFSRYLQQLVMESLGKELDLDGNRVYQGIAVYGNKGSTDQHAYVQQLREGVPNFFATFIEVLEDGGNSDPVYVEGSNITSGDYLSGLLQGTRKALYENGRESITITVPRVNETIVGALIALYERAVSFYASLVNINAYHQPGVEAGKKAAASILDLQTQVVQVLRQAIAPLSLEDLATQADAAEDIETVYFIVRHLAQNKRGVTWTGEIGKPSTLKIAWTD